MDKVKGWNKRVARIERLLRALRHEDEITLCELRTFMALQHHIVWSEPGIHDRSKIYSLIADFIEEVIDCDMTG